MDLCAFLDWAALRPMTELEFEKTARGPYLPLRGEYAWSSKDITAATVLSGTEDSGNEQVATENANVHFSGAVLSGGDAANGAEYQQGPLRTGIFATGSSNRVSSGAGYYGSMDLSGNVAEFVISVGSSAGIGFSGMHGDGYLTTASGSEGNANVAGWPGMDVDAFKGVVIAVGSGLRGGSWMDTAERLRVSDRQNAVYGMSDATAYNGGRGVRSYDGE
jgi:formylglycine-generating enzyme required for sulfatase activity